MKSLRIIVVLLVITLFNSQYAFSQAEKAKEEVYKTSIKKAPQKVQDALKDYSGYKIEKEATFTKKSKGNLYRFKVQKGNWSHYLLIDESGKIIGAETGEHSDS